MSHEGVTDIDEAPGNAARGHNVTGKDKKGYRHKGKMIDPVV